MRRFVFAALIAALSFGVTDFARAAKPHCAKPWDGGKRAKAMGLEMFEVEGKDKASFIFNYNSAEPPTDYRPDHVYLFLGLPEDKGIIVVLVKGKCILDGTRLPEKVIEKLLDEPGNPS